MDMLSKAMIQVEEDNIDSIKHQQQLTDGDKDVRGVLGAGDSARRTCEAVLEVYSQLRRG